MNSAPDLRDRNVKAVFDALDSDGDGVITSADFSTLAARVCDVLGATGTEKEVQLTDIWSSWWEQLAADADANGDGQITREEFSAAVLAGGGDPAAYYQQQVGRMVAAEVELLDADGDGYIDAAEYATFVALAGVPALAAQAGFLRLDTDQDGKISTAELEAGVAHLLLSENPADPGTAMLGHG